MPATDPVNPPSPFAPLVLVVDDDDDARTVARGMLHLIGYRTRVARDGREALRHLRAERPAAILLDLHMPGLDGFGFLDRAARDVPEFGNLPVFVASGVYKDATRVERPLLRRGVWAFVRKPFTVARLREGMRDFIDLVPPHPADPRKIDKYLRDRKPEEGAVVHLSSPGLPPDAVAEAEQKAKEILSALEKQKVSVSMPPTPSPSATRRPRPPKPDSIANTRYPCEFEAAVFCAGAVVPGVVIEVGPSELEFRLESAIASAGDRVVVRAQVEGDAFFDLRLRGTVTEVHKYGSVRHLTVRLEGDRHLAVWRPFLAHISALADD